MYKIKLLLFIFPAVPTFLCCNSNVGRKQNENDMAKKYSSFDSVNEEFKEAFIKSGIKMDTVSPYYILIPGTGCSGCINFAEDFLKENLHKHKNVKYILTKINSLKLLKLKLGINVFDNEIILDTMDNFSNQSLYTIYPTIFFVNKEGNLDSTLNSQSSSFDKFIQNIK